MLDSNTLQTADAANIAASVHGASKQDAIQILENTGIKSVFEITGNPE